jgi:hypothetical protein
MMRSSASGRVARLLRPGAIATLPRFSQNRHVGQRTETRAARASQELALVEELKGLAARLGYEVREERLLREVGYRVRSGACRIRDARVILLERGLPLSAQVDVLVEALAGQRLEDVYISPAVRNLLEGAGGAVPAVDPTEPDAAATP